MTIKMYGIPNCDSVRGARRWLTDRGIEHDFHDFRKDGLSREQLGRWTAVLGWETLLNRRGTSWRQLPESVRDGINAERALSLMLEQPVLIKRPVLELADQISVGFAPEQYKTLFPRAPS